MVPEKLKIPKSKFDEKYQVIDDILKSPAKFPVKISSSEKKSAETIKIENVPKSKKSLIFKQSYSHEAGQECLCVRFDPDDIFLASSFADGFINIYNMNTEKLVMSVNGSQNNTPTTILRWVPKGNIGKNKNIVVSGNSDGTVIHWSIASGKELRRNVEQDNQILALDYNCEGTYYATGGKEIMLRLYDSESGILYQTFENSAWSNSGPSNKIFSLKFHPNDPNLLFSGGWDGGVYFWDLRSKNSIGSLNGFTSLSGDALDFRDNKILTGSFRNQEQLQIWDYSTKNKLSNINWGINGRVEGVGIYGAQFSKINGESILAGSSGKNEVKLFQNEGDYRILSGVSGMKRGVYSVDYGNNSNKVAFGGGEGLAYYLNISLM